MNRDFTGLLSKQEEPIHTEGVVARCRAVERQILGDKIRTLFMHTLHAHCKRLEAAQFHPPIALRTDLSHITTELWEIPVLRMAH